MSSAPTKVEWTGPSKVEWTGKASTGVEVAELIPAPAPAGRSAWLAGAGLAAALLGFLYVAGRR